jgi:hypothetical protein
MPAYIEIYICDPSKYFSAPQNAKDRLENDLLHESKWKNFELFERHPVTVSGVEGELIYYQVDWFLPVPKGEGPGLQYVRAVYFDYGGLTWWIQAKCEKEMIDQVKTDFEHILQTFKILS